MKTMNEAERAQCLIRLAETRIWDRDLHMALCAELRLRGFTPASWDSIGVMADTLRAMTPEVE